MTRLSETSSLLDGWNAISAGGRTPGPDGVTIDAFRRDLTTRIAEIGRDLLRGAYRPGPLRRVQLPKKDGTFRQIGIPNVADRIVQHAAAHLLQRLAEPQFSPQSFAYRAGLGPRRAAEALRALTTPDAWAVTADIEKFFDNVNHRVLEDHVRRLGVEDEAIVMIRAWLRSHALDGALRLLSIKGLPQGAPIAPVLANLYLTPLDDALTRAGFKHVRYADDVVVLAGDRTRAVDALAIMREVLTDPLCLRIKAAKTCFAPVTSGVVFVGFHLDGRSIRIAPEKADGFPGRIRDALGAALPTETIKAHNDLVRGWRAYYGGISTGVEADLARLETSRRLVVDEYVSRERLDPRIVPCFESLLVDAELPAVTGYPEMPLTAVAEPPGESARVFSRAKQVRAAVIADEQRPGVENGHLRVFQHGVLCRVSGRVLRIQRKKQLLFEHDLDAIKSIAVEGHAVAISNDLLRACALRRIPVGVSNMSGACVGRFVARRSAWIDISVAERQIAARCSTHGAAAAAALIDAKLANQRAVLLYFGKYPARAPEARAGIARAAGYIDARRAQVGALAGLPLSTSRSRLLGLEGQAAAAYWPAVQALVPDSYRFARRRGRGATDIINRALNYGYWLLQMRVWNALERVGAHPQLGLLHQGRHRAPGLVLDLMEEFRAPVVDRTVLSLIGRGTRLSITRDAELSLRTRRKLFESFERRLAAPGSRAAGGRSLQAAIEHQAGELRRALLSDAHTYRGYRFQW